jgi:Na+/phosphate symporter
LNLFLNAIDFLAGGTQLSDLRTKDSIDRSFTKIKKISKNVSQEIRNDEVNLITKINDLENKLKNYITNLKIQNISDIDEKTRKELEDIRTKLNEHNNSLRYIRNEIRSEIDQVEYYIKLINILTGPIILFFIFAVCKFNRKIKLI